MARSNGFPRASVAVVLTLAVCLLAGCSASPESDGGAPPTPSASPGGGSANMHAGASACPVMVDVDTPPERVVTLDGSAAAFLVELGLRDQIIGTAGVDFIEDFSANTRSELDSIPVIDPAQGNQEAVLNAEPDFVTGISPYQFGGFEGTATVETLRANGAAALAACGAKAEGENASLDAMFTYIRQLGVAFDVEDRAEGMIENLTSRVKDVAPNADQPKVSTLLLMAVPDEGSGIRTRGGTSYANALISLAGGRSLAAELSGDSVEISAEQVVEDDPAIIVAISGFGPQTPEEVAAAIAASPLLASTDAVKNNAIVVIPHRMLLAPNLLNIDAIKQLASAMDLVR